MYYYILLDKLNKTAQIINALNCLAENKSILKQQYNLNSMQVDNRFKLVFNNQSTSFDNLPKKYNNFKKI